MAMQAGLDLLKQHWKHMESERKVLGKVLLERSKGMFTASARTSSAPFSQRRLRGHRPGSRCLEKTFIEQVKAVKPTCWTFSASDNDLASAGLCY